MKTMYSIHVRSTNPERAGMVLCDSDLNKVRLIFKMIKADNSEDELVILQTDSRDLTCTPLIVK